ncbi:MAG: DUF362 domain-containing protein [Bryobacterales bacterium]|nr:DUF362 domain-containing protein [Bryobacterales bacterium]
MNRRQFFLSSAGASLMGTVGRLSGAPDTPTRFGLVRSTHSRLVQPASLEDALTYTQVRDMVFQAIEYGAPKAGSLAAKIKPGAWVVLKPNIVFLRPHPAYAKGDVTDFRVTRAVLEYVATRSRAGRITIAEGGTYRKPSDKAEDNVVTQAGRRVDALSFDWGPDEFPGFSGSVGSLLKEFAAKHPDKKFDYVDLSYDAVRGPDGKFRRIEVPKAPNGVGAFGARPDYFVTRTITGCDFLISIPVMKIHLQSGITAVLKNYVGTAPREAYALPGGFHNALLHDGHSAGDRIDPFICDLAAFHPPDYCVIDGIRGLQTQEHSVHRPDQTVRSNLVMACEDPVVSDAMVAKVLGFNPHDIEFLHMAQARMMGSMDVHKLDVRGDEPDRETRMWEKPKRWYGRCNREWMLSAGNAEQRHTARFDTIDLPAATKVPAAPGTVYRAVASAQSREAQRGYLWMGLRGKVTALVNGEVVAKFESQTRYRVGQFQFPVTLKSGANRLEFRVEPLSGHAQLSALVTGTNNSGDTPDGLRWA